MSKSYPFTNWDEYNPYSDSIVYVPLDELAKCIVALNGGGNIGLQDGTSVPFTKEFLLDHWKEQQGTALDAYILVQPSGFHDLGVRYGKKDSHYLSYEGDKDKVAALLKKYS